MLDCELCNFFKTKNSELKSEVVCMCELTGFVFHDKVEDYDIEYPCYSFNLEIMEPKSKENAEIEFDELKLA
ncbi:MAG: hypothetical protein Q8930_02475 [Bacillota bacterium]|nr:hypothetical protein [Bacillota bacterium]